MELKIEYLPVKALKPYNKNTRKHKSLDVDNIARSIEKYGFNDAIGIWGDNVIVEGHGRLMAAKKLGLKEVPCVRLDHLTDEQRREYAIAHNATAELSEWDFTTLPEELAEIDLSDFDFDFGLDIDEDLDEQERIFKERMESGELSDDDEEYQEFLKKFEAKKTTDDCYTPDNIYAEVKKWCVERYGLQGKKVLRPFYPGGDYQKEDYSGDCVVIDNPPFSIISEICAWYSDRRIKYFMFAPQLTLLGINSGKEKYVAANASMTYENGAVVNTGFVTNLGTVKACSAPDLRNRIFEVNKENEKKLHRELEKYSYPCEVVTSSMLGYFSCHGTAFEFEEKDAQFIRALDAQKEREKGIFGSAFLLSEKAAAEKAAAEKAAAEKAAAEKAAATVWELSEREREIIKSLG